MNVLVSIQVNRLKNLRKNSSLPVAVRACRLEPFPLYLCADQIKSSTDVPEEKDSQGLSELFFILFLIRCDLN